MSFETASARGGENCNAFLEATIKLWNAWWRGVPGRWLAYLFALALRTRPSHQRPGLSGVRGTALGSMLRRPSVPIAMPRDMSGNNVLSTAS